MEAFTPTLTRLPGLPQIRQPNCGGWLNYQWLGKRRVHLTAGQHVLKLFADRPYFALNSLRVSAASTAPPPASGATRLFSSGFEGSTALAPLALYGNGAWQDINGTDSETGFTWPPKLWGGTGRFQLIAGDAELVTAATIGNYAYDQLQSVTGHNGAARWSTGIALKTTSASSPVPPARAICT